MSKHKNDPFPHDQPFAVITKGSDESETGPVPVFLKQEEPEVEQYDKEDLL